MKIGIDTKIRVRLTPQGKLVLTYWIQKRNGHLGGYEEMFESDVQEMPLWKFMGIFGDYVLFADTQEEYFPGGIEILEGSPENGQT